jgi:GWxTD domain-containing protein
MLPSKDEWYARHYFIMQKFENDAYKAMVPDARLKFQELFWAVRSPAAKKEFETRMAYINSEFKNENAKQPWNTDRARVYLLNGNPASRDYTTDDRWAGNPAGKPVPEGFTDDRMGEDIQARTTEVWKYPFERFFATYAFTFSRPNKWKQTSPSAEAGRYVGQLELKNRMELWSVQDEATYKKRIAELTSVK